MIEDINNLNNAKVNPIVLPDKDETLVSEMWDRVMRSVADFEDPVITRENIAYDLNNSSLNDLDAGTEKFLLHSGKVSKEELDVAFAVGNLKTVTPSTSLETAAGDKIASDLIAEDATYRINTGSEASFESPGAGFTRTFLLDRAITKAASKRDIQAGEAILNRMVIPSIVGATVGAGVGVALGKNLKSTEAGAYIGSLAADVASSSIDYLRSGGVSMTEMQRKFNKALDEILNNPNISDEDIEESVENAFKEYVDVYSKDFQGQIINSATEGIDPYADAVGILPGVGFRLYLKPITATSDAAYDFVKDKYTKRYVSGLKVNDALKDKADELAKHLPSKEVEVEENNKAVKNAYSTAPENASNEEKDIVAAIDTPKEIDKNLYTASIDVESDFPYNVVKTEIDEEKGVIVFYHGSDDGKAMTLSQAEAMMNDYLNMSNWDSGRQVVTTAAKKPFKTFKINVKTRRSGEGSESLGRAGYVSSISDEEASRFEYLSIMNDVVNNDFSLSFDLPFEQNIDKEFIDTGINNFRKHRPIIESPKTDVKKYITSRINELEERRQTYLENINTKLKDKSIIDHYIKEYAIDSVELELLKKVNNNTNTNLMTLTIADPEIYPDNYLTFKKPFTTEAQPALKRIEKDVEQGRLLWNDEHIYLGVPNEDLIAPAINKQDAIAKQFISETLITPIDQYDYLASALGYRLAKKNWRKYIKAGKEKEVALTLEQVPLKDLRLNLDGLFDYEKFSLDLNEYIGKELKRKGIWFWEHSDTNYAVYDAKAFGPVVKQEKWRGNKYEQKFLDNGFGIVYDIGQNGYYVPEIKYFDVDNKKPVVFKQDKRNFRYTAEEIFNNVATKEDK